MNRIRQQLDTARGEYQSAQYPGDLARDMEARLAGTHTPPALPAPVMRAKLRQKRTVWQIWRWRLAVAALLMLAVMVLGVVIVDREVKRLRQAMSMPGFSLPQFSLSMPGGETTASISKSNVVDWSLPMGISMQTGTPLRLPEWPGKSKQGETSQPLENPS